MTATATHDATNSNMASQELPSPRLRAESSEAERRFAARVRRFAAQDRLFAGVTFSFAALVLLTMAGLLLSLLIEAWPAFREFGAGFFVGTKWSPADDVYGAVIAIYGTVITSAIALLIAVPISFGIAVFLTETCPLALRRPLGTAIELLAGVPSIIYGIWGLFIFAPLIQEYVQPWLSATGLPLFSGPPLGVGIFTAGVVLSLMVVPFIASVMRDVFETVPSVLKESAYGIGCTTWEVVRHIVLPYTRVGVIGGIMLALGRALGETMAVTFIIGNSFKISSSIFAPGTTISAAIASEFAESDGLHQSGLILLGLLLFVLTFFVLAAARLMLMRLEKKAGN